MTKFLTKATLAATVATGLFATPAMAETKPFTAEAKILSAITLTKTSDLNFGTITKSGTIPAGGATVTVSQDGTADNCDTQLTCISSQFQRASFTVTGNVGENVDFTFDIPSYAGELKRGPLAADPAVAFTLLEPASITLAAPASGTGPGEGTISIGGEITVLSGTPDGVYSNTVNVTASYL